MADVFASDGRCVMSREDHKCLTRQRRRVRGARIACVGAFGAMLSAAFIPVFVAGADEGDPDGFGVAAVAPAPGPPAAANALQQLLSEVGDFIQRELFPTETGEFNALREEVGQAASDYDVAMANIAAFRSAAREIADYEYVNGVLVPIRNFDAAATKDLAVVIHDIQAAETETAAIGEPYYLRLLSILQIGYGQDIPAADIPAADIPAVDIPALDVLGLDIPVP